MKKILFILSAFFIFSCSEDEVIVPAPVISGVEVGTNNSKIAYPGSDLHLEAQILAEGTIDKVEVEIHRSGSWEFRKDYSEGLSGLKNGELHTHIDIPADAALGNYHVHIKVTDKEGKVTSVESDLELTSDPSVPVADDIELTVEGDELHIGAHINAPNKIARIVLEIHGPTEKEIVWDDDTIKGKDHLHLHQHISIADFTKGHYHVHLIVHDQAGKSIEAGGSFDIP